MAFSHIYCPTGGRHFGDNLGLCIALAQATERIEIGTGIANIYARHPAQMAETAAFIHEISDGRFVLGLGVSHPVVNADFGRTTEKPLATIRQYVADVRAAAGDQPFPPIMLAALRQKMAVLAGEISQGVLWANGVRSHVQQTVAQIPAASREGFIVGNNIRCVVTDDPAGAADAMRAGLRLYLGMPAYQAYFSEAGFTEEIEQARAALAAGDEAAAIAAVSDRMLNELTIIGTPVQIRERVEEWQAAGLNRVALAMESPAEIREVLDVFDE